MFLSWCHQENQTNFLQKYKHLHINPITITMTQQEEHSLRSDHWLKAFELQQAEWQYWRTES